MKSVEIYTDGACSGNPGPGGWAALLIYGDDSKNLTGGAPRSTNNKMELTAALEALRALSEPCNVTLYTDSAYLSRAFNKGWLDKWQRNGWRTSSKNPVKNKKIWQELIKQDERHDVDWVWVKGHADNELNNVVDEMAVAAMEQYK